MIAIALLTERSRSDIRIDYVNYENKSNPVLLQAYVTGTSKLFMPDEFIDELSLKNRKLDFVL